MDEIENERVRPFKWMLSSNCEITILSNKSMHEIDLHVDILVIRQSVGPFDQYSI